MSGRAAAVPRLLLVEDAPHYRRAIQQLLAPRFAVTPVATGHAARAQLAGAPFAAGVFDLGLPDIDGVELVVAARRLQPELPVVVLTINDRRDRILAALEAGAAGYVLKDHAARALLPALVTAAHGGIALSPPIAAELVAVGRGAPILPSPRDATLLTPAERRVLAHLARGLSYDEIGVVLDVSINTVRSRIRSLYEKLEVTTRTEAVTTAVQRGLVRFDGVDGAST